jgi:hypothetical protein
MKAAVLVLAVLIVLAHPAVAITVLAAELAACAVLGWLIWRARRPRTAGRHRRRAA